MCVCKTYSKKERERETEIETETEKQRQRETVQVLLSLPVTHTSIYDKRYTQHNGRPVIMDTPRQRAYLPSIPCTPYKQWHQQPDLAGARRYESMRETEAKRKIQTTGES